MGLIERSMFWKWQPAAHANQGVEHHALSIVSFRKATVLILDRISKSIRSKAPTKTHHSTFKSTKAVILTMKSTHSVVLILILSVIYL